ncbi:hypothetical protein [Streptomyces sp. NPDC102360]|uniref:hypothetical protein n=1 Tax=Streptomyces sp. NPDC102360 TaxID=3366160 RepID=UPI003800A2A5
MTTTLEKPSTAPRRSLVHGRLFRFAVTVHAVAAFGQPAFAGAYLSGDIGGLDWHARGADIVFSLGIGQALVGSFTSRRMRRWWPFAVSMLLVVAESGQYLAGMEGLLWVHIPLGVMIIAGLAVLSAALWMRQEPAHA